MALAPLYYMLGQEPALKGAIVGLTWLVDNRDEDLDDAEPLITIYDHDGAAVAAYTTLPAAMLSNTQSAGDKLIVAYDCTSFRALLKDSHPAGFHCVKRTDMGSVGGSAGSRWAKAHAESYNNIAAADTAIRSDITTAGDTPDPKGFFLSFGYNETVEGLTAVDDAFKADLQQLILDLRTDYGSANLPVVLDLPPKTVAGLSGAQQTSLDNARKVIMEVAQLGTNISYINTDKLRRREGGATIAEKMEYTGESTMDLGRLIAAEMKRLVDGKPSTANLGVPTVIILGEGDTVGVIEDTFLSIGDDFDSPAAAAMIWNWANNGWEPFDGTVNSNTESDGLTKFGVDVTLIDELQKVYANALHIFKLGRLTSALGDPAATGGSWAVSDADIYTTLLAEWDVAKNALFNVQGQVPDVVAIIWIQGEGDVGTQALADAYAVNLSAFIASLRADFGTRQETTTPVIIAQMKDTGFYTAAQVKTVRDAQAAWVAADPAAKLVDLNLLPVHTDQKNLTGQGLFDAGVSLASAASSFV